MAKVSLIDEVKKDIKNPYKSHSIDKTILNFLHSMDKSSFGGKDKIFFYKELVYMLKGGVSLIEAMDIMYSSSENFAVKQVAKEIAYHLHKGNSLSYALSRLPDYFDEGDCAIVKTGEASGNLPLVMQSLADEYTYLNQIKGKYIGAMIYPVMLIIVSFAAVIYLFAGVLPGIFDMIGSQVTELPTVTLVLKNISDFFVANWVNILVIAAAVILLIGIYASTEKGKRNLFKALMSVPLVGQMTKSYYLIKWARYMRLMIHAGMDYVETFRLMRDILRISVYQKMLEHVLAGLQIGKGMYESLKDETDIMPSNVLVLIKVGEETANLEKSMENIIEMYQEELDNSISNFSKAIEPAILVVVGAIVLLIAMGVFGLIFQVMESAGM